MSDLRHDGGWSDRDGVIYKPASLTDAEREAVKRAAGFVEELAHPENSLTAATLRELLERLK